MRAIAAGFLCLLVVFAPPPVQAWGFDVHRFITRRAIDGLPADIKPFFAARREFIAEHSVDPDLFRVLGLRSAIGEEDPNHFLDIDALDEPRPFGNVPREWEAFVARYGRERADKAGRLPWRTEQVFALLVTRLRETGKGTPAYAADNARYLTAVLAHYVEDAHVPFHAVLNYDGQQTNQRGIHNRFESELVLRNLSSWSLAPVTIRPFTDIRAFVFDRLIEGEALVETILTADRKAVEGLEFYDDTYYKTFRAGAGPVVERRVAEAASGVATAIVSAWIAAGRPALPVDQPSTPPRIRR
jgi:hypothetical protein